MGWHLFLELFQRGRTVNESLHSFDIDTAFDLVTLAFLICLFGGTIAKALYM